MLKDLSGIDARDVELQAGGATLRARIGLPQTPSGWVVFAHEGGASLHGSALAAVAHQLNEAGLATLSMELLTPAESARQGAGLDAAALGERLLAGTEWLRSETHGLWGVMGAGEGAAAALWAAADRGSGISSVVACAPRLEAAASRLDEVEAHTLLIVGGADRRALKQARWARRRLANSELVVVPGATRLFDAPAALRVLSERSVDWFKKTLAGDDPAEAVARERLGRESKRRLAAAASLFLMTGWALAPKAGAATAFFDVAGNLATAGTQAGQLGVAYVSGDTAIYVGADGTGHVTVANQTGSVAIKDSLGGAGNTVTPLASAVSRIVANSLGLTGQGGVTGNRFYDVSGVTPAVFTGIPTVIGGTGLANQNSETLFSVIVTDGGAAGTLIGSPFPDWLDGRAGANSIVGNDGGDRLLGTGGKDTIDAGNGDDYASGGGAVDSIVGGAGNDTLDAGPGVDTVFGGDGNDSISMSSGDVNKVSTELADGGPGDDIIEGSQQPSSVDGGSGVNVVLKPSEEWANAGVTVLLPASMTISTSGPDAGTITDQQPLDPQSPYTLQFTNCQIPGMVGTGNIFAAPLPSGANWLNLSDTLDMTGWTGLQGAILYDGNSGDDILIGTAGPDTLNITFGNDSVVGGGGTDFLRLDASPDGRSLVIDSSGKVVNTTARVAISPTITGAASENIAYSFFSTPATNWTDTISSIEQFQLLGSDFNDTTGALAGDTLDISAVSLASAVTVNGAAGPDSVVGSAGADVLAGDSQNDTLQGGAGDDTLAGGNEDDNVLGGLGADNLTGDAGNDTLSGGDGNDTLAGGNGADSLLGDAGADNLTGDAGNDTLSGGDGNDTLAGGDDADSVLGDAGADNLSGNAGNDTLSGGDNDDLLDGSAGNDTLLGDAGNDTLTGGSGDDLLNGAAGNDRYVFGIAYGRDVLLDAAGQGVDEALFSVDTLGALFNLGSLDVSDTAGNSVSGSNAEIESVLGTNGDDRFVLTPGAIPFTVNGSAGQDTLQYNPTGLTGINPATPAAGSGTISANGVQTIAYVNMETVLIQQLVSGARVWQEFE
ncbi:MAG: hypothetical protein NTW86_05315 [Candidatus Sumerlaeota bacterium]|nr:hypothetical protein [Candidatus Sumerlaeota bacterium]